jgi:hypothetical protein
MLGCTYYELRRYHRRFILYLIGLGKQSVKLHSFGQCPTCQALPNIIHLGSSKDQCFGGQDTNAHLAIHQYLKSLKQTDLEEHEIVIGVLSIYKYQVPQWAIL